MEDTPKIWVGSLADYNDGTLHGKWIELVDVEVDEVWADIQTMLDASPFAASDFAKKWGMKAEEWGIFDHEGFQGIRIGLYESIEKVVTIAKALTEYGRPYAAWVDNNGGEPYDPDDGFEDAFGGSYEDEEDFGRQHWEMSYPEANLDDEKLGYIGQYVNWEEYGHGVLTGVPHSWYDGTLYVWYG